LAARRLRFPVVATTHGFLGGDWKQRFYEWLQCRVLRRFDAVIAVSAPMARRLEHSGIPPRRVHVIPNAFDADGQGPLVRTEARQRLALDADAFCVGWIGRLSAEKGPDVMLRALAEAHAADIRVSFIGDGPERRRLEALSRELGVGARVRWHGARLDAPSLVRAFDVVALSSRDEGTPIVLFEAMAACVPIVATSVGGVPDVVSASEATLVPPEDPSALARAIEQITRDPSAAAARAAAARRRLGRDFAPDPWVARVDKVYTEAIRSRTHVAE
jgi:glycosyltransferase involved in cell wall biosynthesis